MLLSLVAILILSAILWGISVRLENTTVADIGWGPGILVIALVYFLANDGAPLRAQLTLILVAIWAIRLSAHLALRSRLLGEDFRYVKMRDESEETWWWESYIRVFLPYALAAWIISLPIYFAIVSLTPRTLTLLDYLGVLLFVVGFAFETLGDEQLRRFRAVRANKDKVLDTGVWKYTRHPNYFGEALLWWGFGVIGLATGGVPGLLGPLILTWLLIFVTGVKPLESTLIYKPGYIQYVGKTPSFLPIPAQVRVQIMDKLRRKEPEPPLAKRRKPMR